MYIYYSHAHDICMCMYMYYVHTHATYVCMCLCTKINSSIYTCALCKKMTSSIYTCAHCTGWQRLIGSPKLQIMFHKIATKFRSLLRKMTYKDKGSYESSPPCNFRCSRQSGMSIPGQSLYPCCRVKSWFRSEFMYSLCAGACCCFLDNVDLIEKM